MRTEAEVLAKLEECYRELNKYPDDEQLQSLVDALDWVLQKREELIP